MTQNKQVCSRLYEQVCMDWLETKTTITTKNKIDVAVQTEKGSGKKTPYGYSGMSFGRNWLYNCTLQWYLPAVNCPCQQI